MLLLNQCSMFTRGSLIPFLGEHLFKEILTDLFIIGHIIRLQASMRGELLQ